MDRSEFLQSILQPSKRKQQQQQVEQPAPPQTLNSGIAPYAGAWTDNEVIHLLKRLCFGAPIEDVTYFSGLTYGQAVDQLLNTTNTAASMGEPLKVYTADTTNTPANDADWAIPIGRTWVNTPTSSGQVDSLRRDSLKAWWLSVMANQPRSVEEKMIIFWSTHFAIEFDTVGTSTLNYDYLKTLRQFALGNFKAMTKAITLNPAMLIYLNNYLNTKTAPDENYARELQELFTLGKGPGSQYTEADVRAAARVLTGYQVNRTTVSYSFSTARHDDQPKQFSAFYGNTVINRPLAQGQQELDDLLNMIFSKDEVAKYLCRRLYRYFVTDNIDAAVEADVITPLAATFIASNFEIKPVLSQLFKSEHFFDVLQYGAMIKSGLDFTIGMVRECKIKFPPKSNPQLHYRHIGYLGNTYLNSIEQSLGDPPNVSGFPAYYQEPLFDKVWINTDTFNKRQSLVNMLVNSGYNSGGFKMFIDVVDFARRMTNPGDPNQLIVDFNKYFYRRTLSQGLRDNIKTEILLTGQAEDYYWTNAWDAYIANPTSLNNFTVVNNRLKTLAQYFLGKLEEYQLM
jgi:uncharacterized protein (DUF1800 family)